MKVSNEWKDYKIIDAGSKEKLEIWKDVILRRPDPSAMWETEIDSKWKDVDGFYHRSNKGGGSWEFKKRLPEFWTIEYHGLKFKVSPTNFKHTGLFPEQASNWDFMMDKISNAKRPIRVLNLFGYTGAATMACAKAGAVEVVHVDAARGMVDWAKENATLCGLENHKIRYIVDDCLKFVLREKRRGRVYDAIVMDPPSFGRGPSGEVWKFEDKISELISACMDILSDKPLFFQINSYTTGVGKTSIENVLKTTLLKKYPNGIIEADEIGLPIEKSELVLPCGIYGRWFEK